jgi:predicted ATPase/DNA-binding XRE family transcriptional regulator
MQDGQADGSTFGRWLQHQRKTLGYTQEALGRRVACSGHAIRKIEADTRQPSIALARRLALQLRIPVARQADFMASARRHSATETDMPHDAAASVPPPFVGRDHEMQSLRTGLAALGSRAGQVIVIEGETGIGKSRLLDELALHADCVDLPVVRTKCHEIEQSVPFHALTMWLHRLVAQAHPDMLAGLDEFSRAQLATLAPRLRSRLAPMPAAVSDGPDAPLVCMLEAFAQLIERLAQNARLVLLLDDLQWIDTASAQALHHLASRPGPASWLMVLAGRSDEIMANQPSGQLHRALLDLPSTEVMVLARLTRGEIGQMMDAQVQGTADAAQVERVFASCGGNPLFVAADMSESGDAAPAVLAVRERLQRLSPVARQLLDAATVLGDRFRFEAMRHAARLSTEAALDGLDELLRHQWLTDDSLDGHYTFTHDPLRRIAEHELSAARRRHLFSRALPGGGRAQD